MLPLKRALTELEHDIRDAHNAMDQVVTISPSNVLDVQGLVSDLQLIAIFLYLLISSLIF